MSDMKKIVDFAMVELQKTIQQIQSGGRPPSPRKLKKLIKKINDAHTQKEQGQISESDFDSLVKNIADNVEKEKK